MKNSKFRNIIRCGIAFSFLAAMLTRKMHTTVHQASSPDKKHTAFLTASCGWGEIDGFGSTFYVEVKDNRSGERFLATEQLRQEGWNSFTPTGLQWTASNEFRCFWGVGPYNGVMSQTFKIKSNPLTVFKSYIEPLQNQK